MRSQRDLKNFWFEFDFFIVSLSDEYRLMSTGKTPFAACLTDLIKI